VQLTRVSNPAAARRLLSLSLSLSLLACAQQSALPRPQPAPATSSVTFERSITPFVVQDENGAPYAHPFLGGLDVPRPHFIDIDGDGDIDLFVQERSNALMFFENTGNARSATFVWRTDKYQNLDVGEWTRFVDLDGDGDLDLLAEQPFSYIKVFRNEGTKQRATYVLAADSLKDDKGAAVFADRQNIPNIVDIDCNGLYDLFLGRVEGTVTRYEEVANSRDSKGVPRFRHVQDRWENIEIVAQLSGSLLHGANTMFFADPDTDGDLDFYWGDFFEDGVLTIPNLGSCASPSFRTEPVPITVGGQKLSTSGYNVPVLIDIDGDHDLDLFVSALGGAYNPTKTAADNFYLLERNGADYTVRTRRFLSTIDVGTESIPALGDIDGDGDLDLLLGNKLDPRKQSSGRLFVFRNNGSAQQPVFRLADTLDLANSFHYAPTLGDLDADGDLDLLLGTWNQGVLVYRNAGSARDPRWQQDTTATIALTRGSNATPALVDIDADGDLDLFVGEASGELNFYRNTGTAQAFRFEFVTDVYEAIDVGRRSHPAFYDFDDDGDFDLISGQEGAGSSFFRNNGSRSVPKFVADRTLVVPLPTLGSPVIVDLNGDRQTELVSGGTSGGLFYYSIRSR
jgi:FG-GAP-like repeat/FG-GAP repeat